MLKRILSLSYAIHFGFSSSPFLSARFIITDVYGLDFALALLSSSYIIFAFIDKSVWHRTDILLSSHTICTEDRDRISIISITNQNAIRQIDGLCHTDATCQILCNDAACRKVGNSWIEYGFDNRIISAREPAALLGEATPPILIHIPTHYIFAFGTSR